MVNQLLQNFLNTVRGYVEQTYNAVRCVYSLKSGSVTFHFSSSLYGDDELDRYREETMAQAIAESHGGRIEVKGMDGKKIRFKVVL